MADGIYVCIASILTNATDIVSVVCLFKHMRKFQPFTLRLIKMKQKEKKTEKSQYILSVAAVFKLLFRLPSSDIAI